jgi:hypothetical protein
VSIWDGRTESITSQSGSVSNSMRADAVPSAAERMTERPVRTRQPGRASQAMAARPSAAAGSCRDQGVSTPHTVSTTQTSPQPVVSWISGRVRRGVTALPRAKNSRRLMAKPAMPRMSCQS